MTENEIKKEKKDIKDTFLTVTVWTLIGFGSVAVAGTLVYSWIDTRITLLEINQKSIIEQKANKDDLKIIELKLKNIDSSLDEIKKDLKEIKK